MSRLDERQQRILTTHTGSLPRPDALSALLLARNIAFPINVNILACSKPAWPALPLVVSVSLKQICPPTRRLLRRSGPSKARIAAIPWPQESAFGNPKNGLKHRGKGATRLRSKLAA